MRGLLSIAALVLFASTVTGCAVLSGLDATPYRSGEAVVDVLAPEHAEQVGRTFRLREGAYDPAEGGRAVFVSDDGWRIYIESVGSPASAPQVTVMDPRAPDQGSWMLQGSTSDPGCSVDVASIDATAMRGTMRCEGIDSTTDRADDLVVRFEARQEE